MLSLTPATLVSNMRHLRPCEQNTTLATFVMTTLATLSKSVILMCNNGEGISDGFHGKSHATSRVHFN
jgi:hypothetical protein